MPTSKGERGERLFAAGKEQHVLQFSCPEARRQSQSPLSAWFGFTRGFSPQKRGPFLPAVEETREGKRPEDKAKFSLIRQRLHQLGAGDLVDFLMSPCVFSITP